MNVDKHQLQRNMKNSTVPPEEYMLSTHKLHFHRTRLLKYWSSFSCIIFSSKNVYSWNLLPTQPQWLLQNLPVVCRSSLTTTQLSSLVVFCPVSSIIIAYSDMVSSVLHRHPWKTYKTIIIPKFLG